MPTSTSTSAKTAGPRSSSTRTGRRRAIENEPGCVSRPRQGRGPPVRTRRRKTRTSSTRPLSRKESHMANELQGRKVAILAADGVERVELEQPRQAIEDAGAETTLLSIHEGEIQARNHDIEEAGTFTVDGLVSEASVEDYDALLLPGGTVNPDQLRIDDAVGFVRDWFETGK